MFTRRSRATLLAAGLLMSWASGCVSRDRYIELREQVIPLKEQIRRLEEQNVELREELENRRARIRRLQALGDKRMDMLPHAVRLELGRYTGGFDSDETPGQDAVKVYIQPIDQDGDVIKAPGEFRIRVFDLAADEEQQVLLSECRYSAQEVRDNWYGGFITYHYSFVCPWRRQPTGESVAVRVEFVSYWTGEKLTAEKVVPVKPGPATQPETDADTDAPATAPAADSTET